LVYFAEWRSSDDQNLEGLSSQVGP